MRTLLTEIAAAEDYLQGRLPAADALLFEARTLLDPTLAQNIAAQQQSYALIKLYGRRQLKAELDTVNHKLFTQPQHSGFAQRIKRLFGRQ